METSQNTKDIAFLQETYSEALSVQLRSKRNVLGSLQEQDTLFRGGKRRVRGSYISGYEVEFDRCIEGRL